MKKPKKSISQIRIEKSKAEFIERLKQAPIIQLVCEKMGIPRSTLYRWKDEDLDFEDDIADAISEGQQFMDDIVENKFMALVNDKHWPAIHCYITRRHPKYRLDKKSELHDGKLSLFDLAKRVAEREEEERKRKLNKKKKAEEEDEDNEGKEN